MKVAKKLKSLSIQLSPGKVMYKPNWIVLGVNNICNLHCKMCDVGTSTLQTNFATNLVGTQPLNMPLPLIKLIIDQVKSWSPGTKIGYAFTEPLIYPHLTESIAYASSKGIYTSITTNGLNLSQMAQELGNSGLKEINVSLDGLEETHNQIRGHKSSFQRALKGIEHIFSLGKIQRVSIFCVITEWNVNELHDFVKYFQHLPVSQIGFMHTNYTTEQMAFEHNRLYGNQYPATSSNISATNISTTNIEHLYEQINRIKTDKFKMPVTFHPDLNSEEQLKVFYHRPEIFIGKRCNDVWDNMMIKSDGSVIPAHGRCYNLTIGNIYNEELKEIWNSGIISAFRQNLMRSGGLFPACSRCCSAF